MTTNQALRLFLLIITDAGGEGKTFVTLMLQTIFDLLNEQVLTLDTDPGNRAASSTGGSAKFLDPFGEPEETSRRIKDKLGANMSLLIDAGANMQAASRQFEDMCRDVGNDLKDDNYIVHALWIVSTNKLAAAGSAIRAARRIDPPFRPLFVFNDRDGSGAIPKEIKPDIVVEHLTPGLVALVNQEGGFTPVVTNGILGYQHSADMIAAFLWRFADQPALRTLLGDDRINQLQPMLDRQVLGISPYMPKTPLQDGKIEQLSRKANSLRRIGAFLEDDEAISAAVEFLKNR
jgi:CobQ/CobB/MinD/ParA nucleotide binding domain